VVAGALLVVAAGPDATLDAADETADAGWLAGALAPPSVEHAVSNNMDTALANCVSTGRKGFSPLKRPFLSVVMAQIREGADRFMGSDLTTGASPDQGASRKKKPG